MENHIDRIKEEIHIKWLSKAITAKVNDGSELTVLPYGYLKQAVEEALTSTLKEIEGRIEGIKPLNSKRASMRDEILSIINPYIQNNE